MKKLRVWCAFFLMTFGGAITGAGSIYLGSYVFWNTENLWIAAATTAAIWVLGALVSGFACAKLLRLWRMPVLGIAMIYAIFATPPIGWAISRYILNPWTSWVPLSFMTYVLCALLMASGQSAAILVKSQKRGRSMKATLKLSGPPAPR